MTALPVEPQPLPKVKSYDGFQMIPPNKVVETNLQLLRQPTEHRVHLGDCLELGNIRQQIENSSNDLADREKSRKYFLTKKRDRLINIFDYLQCDQIWRNFATLVKSNMSGYFLGFI